MPFILLVLCLLGGGLVCLLVINTTLGASSFRISQLQARNASLGLQQQYLQGQIQRAESPAEIARRAYQLGMRPELADNILDLRTNRIYHLPAGAGTNGQVSLATAGMTDPTSAGVTSGHPAAGQQASGHRAARHPAVTRTARHRTAKRHHRRTTAGRTGSGR